MHWLLTPFDRHADDGFGAMGTAFKTSAETLLAQPRDSVTHRELPTCFLLRHGAELFLKSGLIIAHRFLAKQSGSLPRVSVDGKRKPLTTVHGLAVLYAEFVGMLTQHRVALEAQAKTQWLPMPPELDAAIATIDGWDARGAFFRYPTESNAAKSANKTISSQELAEWDSSKRGAVSALVVVNTDDEIVEAFRYDAQTLSEELKTLQTACQWLECFHVGLRVELAGGW